MGRRRIAVGESGRAYVTTNPRGAGYQARVQVRDGDGRLRIVTATAATKGGAERALQRTLERRADPTITGITATHTVTELGLFWLQHRETHGKRRTGEPLAPQTLAGYRATLNQIDLALGALRVHEVTPGVLDKALGAIQRGERHGNLPAVPGAAEGKGRSTRLMRAVLKGMFDLAVRHGAVASNPVAYTEGGGRRATEIRYLSVEQACHLRQRVRREVVRTAGRVMPNRDLEEVVDFLLGTGCRDGEALAVRWCDLDLEATPPTVSICGTLIEPRKGYVARLHRQPYTKTRSDRTLILPDHLVAMLQARRQRAAVRTRLAPRAWDQPGDPVFATARGTWINPSNIRTRLRKATLDDPILGGAISPHVLRRTVGTLLAHEAGLDAARDQLGHTDGGTTFTYYVGRRSVAPDNRWLLDRFFAPDAGSAQHPGDDAQAAADGPVS